MRKRSFSPRNRAYTLIELLIAVSVLLLIASYAVCTAADNRNADFIVRREAEELYSWLTERTAFADASVSSFTLAFVTLQNGENSLKLIWDSGPYYARREEFKPEGCTFSFSGATECIYSGEWHTLTPSASFTLRCTKGGKTAARTVSVSGQGYVSVK